MESEDHHGEISPPRRLWCTPTWLIAHVAGDANRAVVNSVAPSGRTDYAILASLDEFGSVTQAAMGRRLGLDRSDISVALDRLGAAGMITRSPDPAHARRKLVTLTLAGKRQLGHLEDEIGQAQQRLLAPLTPAERDQLTVLLQVLVQHHRGFRIPPPADRVDDG